MLQYNCAMKSHTASHSVSATHQHKADKTFQEEELVND